jgi:hypothetical protein
MDKSCRTYGNIRTARYIAVVKPERKGPRRDLHVDGRLLKFTLKKQCEVWNGLIWFRIGTRGGLL